MNISDSINHVPFSDDIYEITYKDKNNEILYVNKDDSYIFQTDIISVPNALNITRERREALAAAKGIASEDDNTSTKNPDNPRHLASTKKSAAFRQRFFSWCGSISDAPFLPV